MPNYAVVSESKTRKLRLGQLLGQRPDVKHVEYARASIP